MLKGPVLNLSVLHISVFQDLKKALYNVQTKKGQKLYRPDKGKIKIFIYLDIEPMNVIFLFLDKSRAYSCKTLFLTFLCPQNSKAWLFYLSSNFDKTGPTIT